MVGGEADAAALADGAVNGAVRTGNAYQLSAVHCPTATIILLAPGVTIELTGTPLTLHYGHAIEVRAIGPAGATIDAKGLSRVFTIGGEDEEVVTGGGRARALGVGTTPPGAALELTTST